MGHERGNTLPKSKRWRELVQQIAASTSSEESISRIAQATLRNVRSRFTRMRHDPGVAAAFTFLVTLATSNARPDPARVLSEAGILPPEEPTPVGLLRALKQWAARSARSPEYAEIADRAAGDAMARWYAAHRATDALLEFAREPYESWRGTATGSGFCRLARLFFAALTERYLNYFVEREASAALPTLHGRDAFKAALHEHVEEVSNHAFETARITESFAAGWFVKHAQARSPSPDEVDGFLSLAFGKMQEELLLEEGASA